MKKDDWVICLDSMFCVSTWGQIMSITQGGAAEVKYSGPIWESNLWDTKHLLLQSSEKGAKNFFEKNEDKYFSNTKGISKKEAFEINKASLAAAKMIVNKSESS